MPSLYDNIKAINSSYVPQYVGSNFDQLSKAADTLDQRYRDNMATTNKVAIMAAQDQFLAQDQHIKDDLQSQVYKGISDIASSDKNFENSSAAVSKLAKDYYTNQHRIMGIENFKKVQETRELQTRLGGNFLNFGDSPDTFTTVDPTTGAPRRFTPRVEQRLDYSQKMQHLLGKAADDGYTISPTGQKITFDDYERYLIKSGQVNLLTKDKLNNLVEGLLPAYKASGEGQQDVRRLTDLEGFSPNPIRIRNGKGYRSTNAVDEDIRDRFRALAAPQAFSKTAQRWDDFGIPVGKKTLNTGAAYTPTNPGPVTDNNVLNPIDQVTDDYTVKEGGENYVYKNKQTGQLLPRSANPLESGTTDAQQVDFLEQNYDKVKVDYNAQDAALRGNFQKTVNQLPSGVVNYAGFDDYRDSYRAAVKNQQKITPTGNVIEPAQADQYDDLITRAASSSPLYFKEADQPVQGLEQLAKKIGTSPSNIKFKAVKVFYDSPRADLPGGYVEAKLDVTDTKVKEHPVSVFIPLNDQFVGLAAPIDELYKNSFYAGRDSYTMEHPFVPNVAERPMMNAQGERLGFWTTTYPLPKNQQKEGQPGFRTIVHSVKIVPNNSGGFDTVPMVDGNGNEIVQPIGQWKQFMTQAISPYFKNSLNSGQTFNTEDYKKQGLEY